MSESPEIENRIVNLLQIGDKQALNLLYRDYSEALYQVVYAVVSNETDAEDVMQDAFVKVWRNGKNYDKSKGRLFTWLLRIFRNTAIDKVRSKSFKNRQKNQELENSVTYSESYQLNIEVIGLSELLMTLSPSQREVVELAYLSGYTHAEIADELNIPLGTAKTRLRMAIKNLRERIQ